MAEVDDESKEEEKCGNVSINIYDLDTERRGAIVSVKQSYFSKDGEEDIQS